MNPSIKRSSSSGGPSWLLLWLIFLALLASRRWDQLASPQVWCEDAWLLEGFIKVGWHEFLVPLNGYLVLVPKLITRSSLALSVYYYPAVSSVLTWLFTSLVGLAVALSPTRLKGRVLCAVAIFVIPSDPEVFGASLYTLWWSMVFLLLLAVWDENVPALFLRSVYAIAGGLSSPFVFVVLPVLYFRAFWYKSFRSEKIVASVATVAAAIQFPFVFFGAEKTFPSFDSIRQYVIPKFCGWFVLGNYSENGSLLWALGIVVVILVARYLYSGRREPTVWFLCALYIGAICSSIFRVNPSVFNAARAGPRYFFLPFVLTFWIIIQSYFSAGRNGLRALLAAVGIAAFLNAIPVWSRRHKDMQWADNVRSGRLFTNYDVRVQYDGSTYSGFLVKNTGTSWDALLRRDRLVSWAKIQGLPTFAYRVVSDDDPDQDNSHSMEVSQLDVGAHEVVLRLRRGNRVRFRSGAVSDYQKMEVVGGDGKFIGRLPMTSGWVTLEFSNSMLPREFTVKVSDQGQGVGEWSTAVN